MTPYFNAVSRSRATYLITAIWTVGQVLLGNWVFFLCFYASALVGSVLNIWDILFEKSRCRFHHSCTKNICAPSLLKSKLPELYLKFMANETTWSLWCSSASITCFIQITILILAHSPPVHLHAVELMWAPVLERESVSRSVVSNSLRPYGL